MKIKIKVKQAYEAKMTPEELEGHLKMKNTGAGVTKNKKKITPRKEKHKGEKHYE